MGQVREVDAISDAIIATEREIAGEAWGNEETDALDESGDQSLEQIGEGLEGQQEAADEDDADGEEAEGDEDSDEGEDGGEAEGETDGKGKDKEPEPKPGEPQQRQPEGRIPPGKLREANDARRAVEAERDQLRVELEAAKKAPGDNRSEIDTLKTQVSALTQLLQGQRQQPQQRNEEPPKPAEVPDIFENPKGFVDHITGLVSSVGDTVKQQLAATRVETSMATAHALHKDTFTEAFAAISALNPQNPEDRVTVQRIYNSPNPGEALVNWHKRSRTLARVGDDPDAFVENVRKETRQSLLNDPEFRKELLASMRGEAATGEAGAPRTTNRLPQSLARAGGSNLGADRTDKRGSDDSEQAVADAAWR